MIMPCVEILSPIIMDTSSSANQIKNCKTIDFCLTENNPITNSPPNLESSDQMGSGYRTNNNSNTSNNNCGTNNSSNMQTVSPDLPQSAYPMVSTPQPPPLDLSNLPNSPNKIQNIDSIEVLSDKTQTSPKLDSSPPITTTTVNNTTNNGKVASVNTNSNVKCDMNSTPQDMNSLVPALEKLVNVDWTETLKQYNESQTTMKGNTNLSPLSNEIDLAKILEHNNNYNNKPMNEQWNRNPNMSSPDFTARFQAMLSNLSEFLFNSSQAPNFSKSPTSESFSYSTPSSSSASTATSISTAASPISQMMNSDKFKSDNRCPQLTGLSNPIYPLNFMGNQMDYNMFNSIDFNSTNPSLALTASLLSLLASSQKQNTFPEQSTPPSSKYSKCPVSSPRSYPSPTVYSQPFLGNTSLFPPQVSPNFLPPSVSLPRPSLPSPMTSNPSMPPTSCPIIDMPSLNEPKLSDPRDLLYQLGQQLMAMATSSGIDGNQPNLDLWNTNKTDSKYNPLSLPSFNTSANSAYLQPPTAPNTGSLPLQPGCQSSSLLPSVSTAYNSSGMEKNFSHLPPTSQHHSSSNTGPFSGISMRGNQKYSAYYQHQRKQGFQASGLNECVSNTVGRRQRSSLSPMSTNTRYAGRRLRSGLNNSLLAGTNLEMRNFQRFPPIRNQTVSTVNNTNMSCNSSSTSGAVLGSTSGSNLCSNFRGNTPYRMNNMGNSTSGHVLNTTKSQLHTENINSSAHGHVGNNNNSGNNPPQQTTRHRETAFVCSCGKDFESLYIFTLHMKDTGHKPKCDQAEKDIPKLVRGQDMWINSETEQTREILRCMRCHQSFRSLPELTMHMMKTNHYSEIVYNDSGRCVFVNPDDNRRGGGSSGGSGSSHLTGNSSSGNHSGMSHMAGKSGISLTNASGGRRSHRSMNMNWSGNSQTILPNARFPVCEDTAKQQIKQNLPSREKYEVQKQEDASKRFRHSDNEQSHPNSDHFSASVETKIEVTEGMDDKQHTNSQENLDSSLSTKVASTPPPSSCNDDELNNQCNKSEMFVDNSNEVATEQNAETENNVLQQIESFVEKSLPQTTDNNDNNLSITTELTDQSIIQSSSPISVNTLLDKNSITTTTAMKLSPKLNRKRTFSEAGISVTVADENLATDSAASMETASYSPISSPLTVAEGASTHKETDFDLAENKRAMTVTSNSPNTSKVSSTSEMNMSFSESPLSSLQKLVDTTHKPIKSTNVLNSSNSTIYSGLNSSNSNTSNSNRFPRSGGLTVTSTVHSQYSPNKSGINTCPNSPYSVHSTTSSGKLQASPLSPLGESDHIIPALSALYAYVERSSSSSSSSHIRDSQNNLKGELPSPNSNNNNNSNNESTKSNVSMSENDRLDDGNPNTSQLSLNHLSNNSTFPSTSTAVDVTRDHGNTTNTSSTTPLSLQSTSPPQLPITQQTSTPQNASSLTIPTHPLIQAIYAAAMSNLAGQYLNPQVSSCAKNTNYNDPLNAFKYAAMNFKEALDSFELGTTSSTTSSQSILPQTTSLADSVHDAQNADFANNWLNMLRSLVENTEKLDSCNTECNSKSTSNYHDFQNSNNRSNNNSTPDRSDTHQYNDFVQHSPKAKSSSSSAQEPCTPNSQQNMSPSLPSESTHLNYPSSMNYSRPNYSYASTLPSSSSSLSSTISSLMSTTSVLQNTRLTNMPPSFHSMTNRNLSSFTTTPNNIINMSSSSNNNNASSLPNNNLMTTITKKAKCHFCGKPFANKGQVRLHISKNKCPCLLQQSCHVAALAAAFGSNSNNNNSGSNIPKVSQPIGTLKSIPINSHLPSVPCKRSNNNSGNNTNIDNTNQNFTDPMHNFSSNALRPTSKNDLTNAPSALSLLKERFQNFDVHQNPAGYTNFASYLPTNVTNPLEFNLNSASSSTTSASTSNTFLHPNKISTPPPPSSISNVSWLGTPNSAVSFSSPQINKDTEIMNNPIPGTASAAAVNAGHLAAMALLAQTLVQLTTATQSAPASNLVLPPVMSSVNNSNITPSKQNPSENTFDPNNHLLPFLVTNLSANKQFPNINSSEQPPSMPFNFNLETLLNQMNMAKQLNSFNWPVNNQPMNPDDNQSCRPSQSQQQQQQQQSPQINRATPSTNGLS
ncbi:unnamed protein product [Trichobilharzia szidati]|nr:unnamed protein product [Trichobilharzia szidati]